jgi:hypothetical protein
LLADVELGLYTIETLVPTEPAHALWALLTGYPFPRPSSLPWETEQRRRIGIVRHYILHYKSRYEWTVALSEYASLPADVRGYDVNLATGGFSRRPVVIAANRWQIYESTLAHAPSYRTDRLERAVPGSYVIPARRRPLSVMLPKSLPLPPPPASHDLRGRAERTPLEVCWNDLLETASWMDEVEAVRGVERGNWRSRLERVWIEIPDAETSQFQSTQTLAIDGILHLLGMVSSGKSTLMDVLAVWAARSGRHVTLVVGDVVGALRRVEVFRALDVPAAPILGASNRKRHVERIHRVLTSRGIASPLMHEGRWFDFVSTACALDGLREGGTPLALDEAPCRNLEPVVDDDTDGEAQKRLGCPLWSCCQRHRGAHDLVSARIWVATEASLIYSQVPIEINPERLRYLELVYRHSDLVIVDECDQVQVQLDAIFSPGQTLVGRVPDSWLDNVLGWKDQELARGGRNQFGETGVGAWNVAADAARTATNRLYALLRQTSDLQAWIEKDYFSEWTLAERLARDWSAFSGADESTSSLYRRLREAFEQYLADPLGSEGEADKNELAGQLAALTRQALPISNAEFVRRAVRMWITSLPDLTIDADEIDIAACRLEFTLLLAVLSDRLNYIFHTWKQVEAPLNLEGSGSLLFHRPPEDYAPVVPESPMGNVLGFQYLRDGNDLSRMGELRFFRCAGWAAGSSSTCTTCLMPMVSPDRMSFCSRGRAGPELRRVTTFRCRLEESFAHLRPKWLRLLEVRSLSCRSSTPIRSRFSCPVSAPTLGPRLWRRSLVSSHGTDSPARQVDSNGNAISCQRGVGASCSWSGATRRPDALTQPSSGCVRTGADRFSI